MKPASEVIEVNLEEWETLLERARREPLDEASYQKLQAALRAFRVLTEMIGEKNTTISRLRALLAKPSTRRRVRCWSKRGSRPLRKAVRLRTRRARRSRGTVETAPRRMAGLAGSRSRTLPSSRETVVRSARRVRFTNRKNPLYASG